MIKKGIIATALCVAATTASADVVGVHGRVGAWMMDYSGEFKDLENNGTVADIEDDLGFDGETVGFAEIAFEHPIPLLPNIKLAYMGIDTSEESRLDRNITMEGVTFLAGTEVKTDFQAEIYDTTLYYELMDNWIQADLGLTVRYLDIDLELRNTFFKTTNSLSTPLPMIYANAQFDLPLTDVYANVNFNGLTIDDIVTYDAQAAIGWMPLTFAGAELGYRHFVIEADDLEDYDFDLTLSGPYLALKADF
ncbi:TIGR04219 family outer membrane beta-barrel protein [Litoribacillus peritrichatus]|uniref:TIGR04219 family outer membrane beta-barrel protein n=1 Tax=Litoribacillus peritrichatus TaxID=718191 RepID=A0ABP7MCK3_9GAMM